MQLFARQFGKLSIVTRSLQSPRHQVPLTLVSGVRKLHGSCVMASPLKRKAEKPASSTVAKKQKVVVPEYHTTPQRRDDSGEVVWPARKQQIERARELITEWYVHLNNRVCVLT